MTDGEQSCRNMQQRLLRLGKACRLFLTKLPNQAWLQALDAGDAFLSLA